MVARLPYNNPLALLPLTAHLGPAGHYENGKVYMIAGSESILPPARV